MKIIILIIIYILSASAEIVYTQSDPFLNDYYYYKSMHQERAVTYQDIEGSPYLNTEFTASELYLKDSVVIKLKIRYNIYTDEMEYQYNGSNYLIVNKESIRKIKLGESEFIYMPYLQKGGFFELVENGKTFLLQKRIIEFKPAEGPKPIVATSTPAKFISKPDIFFIVVDGANVYRIKNLKSVVNAFQDQKTQIENFLKSKDITNCKKDNLIKIVKYYNDL